MGDKWSIESVQTQYNFHFYIEAIGETFIYVRRWIVFVFIVMDYILSTQLDIKGTIRTRHALPCNCIGGRCLGVCSILLYVMISCLYWFHTCVGDEFNYIDE